MFPERLAHYRILEKRGVSGMGAVNVCRGYEAGPVVAIKVLPPRLAKNRERLSRFGS
jgi:hypothetical protein